MKVTVYTTPTCPYCHQVKDFLAQRGMRFIERDVSADGAAAAEMIQRTGQRGVPVTTIDDQVVVGFDRARLEHLLASQRNDHRASLGVQVADASKLAQRLGSIPVFGALVGAVKPGSPGERVGLRQGDVITETNLRPIRNVEDLERVLAGLSSGSRLAIAYRRAGDEFRTETVL